MDGVLRAETTASAGAMTRDNALYFGSREGKADFFPGLIDDVRLYSLALPPQALTAEALGIPTVP